MAKVTIAITLDSDIAETIRSMNINKSELINDFLRSYINQPKDNKGVEKAEVQKQLEVIEKDKVAAITKEAELKQTIHIIEIQEAQSKDEAIKQEEEFKSKQKLCVACNCVFEHTKFETLEIDGKDRFIHTNCFLTTDNFNKYIHFVKPKKI